jgi:sporulation protein YlmC with PRC-barrel domain
MNARAAIVIATLALPAAAQPAPGTELFSRLDRDADGVLSSEELEWGRATPGWIALDRDRDGRITPDEFEAADPALPQAGRPPAAAAPSARMRDPIDLVSWTRAARLSGYRAQALLGDEVTDFAGNRVGALREITVDSRRNATALIVEAGGLLADADRYLRVPWRAARITGAGVSVPLADASVGSTRIPGSTGIMPVLPTELRMSELLQDAIEIDPGARYANVEDIVIDRTGKLQAIVVDVDTAGAAVVDRPYGRSQIGRLAPFDLRAFP